MYKWDFGWVWTYRVALLVALGVTLKLNAIVLLLGSCLGMLVALARSSRRLIPRYLAIAYIDLIRSLPMLVMLIWFFFCVPILFGGIRLSPWICAIVVLSLNLSAFVAEIIRTGVESVSTNLVDGARCCGLTERQVLAKIVMPIALRNMVPPLVGQYINSVKLSVLASVIAVPELLQKTTDLASQVYRPLEFYTALAFAFLIILLPPTALSRKLESSSYLAKRSSEV
jgi:polar amino acid transport system permease protein